MTSLSELKAKFRSQQVMSPERNSNKFPEADTSVAEDIAWKATKIQQQDKNDKWFLDSGCTSHIGSNIDLCNDVVLQNGPQVAGLGNSITALGKGKVQTQGISLSDNLYVLSAPCNLISISKITARTGRHVIFTNEGVYLSIPLPDILKKARKIGTMKNGLYELSVYPTPEASLWTVDIPKLGQQPIPDVEEFRVTKKGPTTGDIWHARLGHPGRAVYKTLAKMANLPELPYNTSPTCPSCALAKGSQHMGKTSVNHPSAPLELIQVDICGGFRYHDYVDNKYFLTIVDKYERKGIDFPYF